jgi:hypothetical protein
VLLVEDELRQEFVVRAPSFSSERPASSWDWYFLMQHSGAPTRLLDWTEGALIALYFAVRAKNDETDAAVWALDPWWLNKKVVGKAEVIPPGAGPGLLASDANRYKSWLPDRYEVTKLKSRLPAAVYPTHFSRRISSQQSCFTVHGTDPVGFDELQNDPSARIAKITIPSEAVRDMRSALSIAGIDELTIFPDLDGLGRYVASIFRDESRGSAFRLNERDFRTAARQKRKIRRS